MGLRGGPQPEGEMTIPVTTPAEGGDKYLPGHKWIIRSARGPEGAQKGAGGLMGDVWWGGGDVLEKGSMECRGKGNGGCRR